MRKQYRIVWTFDGRPELVRLAWFDSPDAATRAANAEEWYRGVFRRAGIIKRHPRSEYEYMDRSPVPAFVSVAAVVN